MKKEQIKNIIMIILLLAVILLVTLLVIEYQKPKDKPDEKNITASLEKQELIKLLKNDSKISQEPLQYFLIEDAIFLGQQDNTEVYRINGIYQCQKENSCLKSIQQMDSNQFQMDVAIEEKQITSIQSEYPKSNDFREANQLLKEERTELEKQILASAKEGAKDLGIDYQNIEIQYSNQLENLNIYYVYGQSNKIIDDTLFVVSKEEKGNEFHFYMSGVIENGKFTTTGYHQVHHGIIHQIHQTSDFENADYYINMLKNYFHQQNFVTAQLKEWNINEVKYIGYYQPDNKPLLKMTGTYSCKDGGMNCLYLPQVSDKLANGNIPFEIIINVTNNQITQLFQALPIFDFVSINKVIN